MSSTPVSESPQSGELLSVGQQCHAKQCYMVDFLPFKCDHCKHSFCAEHFKPEEHSCEKYDPSKHDRVAPSCPLCNKPVAIPIGQDPNIRMGQHIDRECEMTTGRADKPGSMPVCSRGRCGKRLIAPIRCDGCNKQFCPEHRYPSSHLCNTASIPSGNAESTLSTLGTKLANQTSVQSAAAMAAIKRSMANVSISSSSSASKPMPPKSTQSDRPSTNFGVLSGSFKESKNPFSKTDRRAKAEQESRLRGMRERARKGLLSETEKVQLAEIEAGLANRKKDEDCIII